MGAALGPDLWNNAPEASAPINDLREWLGRMAAAAAAWTPAANQNMWNERFAGVQFAIADAFAALPESDVFARPEGVRAYEHACKVYQDTKDAFVLSPDWLLTIAEQAGVSPVAPDFLDKAMAFLRSLGIGLIGVAVLVVVLAVVVRRALN